MPLVPLSTWLLRAPLLAVDALERPSRAFADDPLGAEALALASPGLAAAKAGEARDRAVSRYARRAAGRPTPHGLLAGVATGTLGEVTKLATGTPTVVRAPSWARLAALGDGLRAEPAVRPRVRVAPSLISGAFEHLAIAGDEEIRVSREPVVDAVLAAACQWIGRDDAIEVARRAGAEAAEDTIDVLLDVGLLHHDLRPPLVGPPPHVWMRARLAGTPWADAVDALEADAAVLVHRPKSATLARDTVERAAALAGILFRLQDALHPPAAERLLEPALADALAAIDAVVGPGAVRVDDLIAGRLGVTLGEQDAPPAPAPPSTLTALLVDALAAGTAEVALDPDALDAVLPDVELPRTFEIFLQGASGPSSGRARRASPPAKGHTGWLLGLHAPAGATWGRFAHALGAPLTDALGELDAREREAAPHEERLDVAWSPSPALADVVAHPPVRARTLALAAWPDDGVAAVTADALELVADPSRAAPLTLRDGATRRAVAPAPLARLRASTAPPGAARLLLGWSLVRQHAPWALVWPAALAAARTPRITLDGFVIAPASWRLPAVRDRRALAAWRRAGAIPRWVVVGTEDELLPVDLDDATSVRDLEGHDRVTELWPPPERTLDRDGRRVEAVIAVVDVPDADERAAAETPAARTELAARAAASAPTIPCPADAPAEPHVTTLKLYGAADAQDRLLGALAPVLVRAERRGGPLRAWWFQRFVEPPGERAHLRLRLAAPAADVRAIVADVLDDARRAGDLVDVTAGDYRREIGRFGADAPAVDKVFASESRLVVDLLAAPLDEGCDLLELAVRAADALAQGLGLDAAARLALAARLRAATAADVPDLDEARAELRERRARLDAALAGTLDDAATPQLAAHVRRLERLRVAAVHLPVLVHLGAVRLAGPAPTLEAFAALAWERTLASLRARAR